MATQLLSRVVLQQVTQQVLPRVIQQLPELMARTQPGTPQQAPVSDLSRMNALAIGELRTALGQTQARAERDAIRLDRLERQADWRRTALTLATAVVAYGIGFGTAIALALLGAFG